MKLRLCLAGVVVGIAVLLSSVAGTSAQSYPNKPIRFIVPYMPGSAMDVVARAIGQKLTESWGQPVVVDNKPGANTIIGAEMLAKATPDGYTIMICGGSTLAINPSLYSKLPYNPTKDFAPVSLVIITPFILVVHPSLPAKSVKELILLSKSQPGKLNYGSGGNGSSSHLSMELFKSMAGVDMVHIPYKSNAPGFTDLLGGQVSLMFVELLQALPHMKTGKVRPLGMAMRNRSPMAPDVPTISEAGLPDFESNPWMGVLTTAGTSKEIIAKLNTEIVKIMHLQEVKNRLFTQGVEPFGSTPEQFVAYINTETAKWAKLVKQLGIRVD